MLKNKNPEIQKSKIDIKKFTIGNLKIIVDRISPEYIQASSTIDALVTILSDQETVAMPMHVIMIGKDTFYVTLPVDSEFVLHQLRYDSNEGKYFFFREVSDPHNNSNKPLEFVGPVDIRGIIRPDWHARLMQYTRVGRILDRGDTPPE
jgi:hypothetical protein